MNRLELWIESPGKPSGAERPAYVSVGREFIGGRGEDVDLFLGGDDGVSRMHFRVIYDRPTDTYHLLDESTYGTFPVPGNQRLEGPYRLEDGTRFRVPPYVLFARIVPNDAPNDARNDAPNDATDDGMDDGPREGRAPVGRGDPGAGPLPRRGGHRGRWQRRAEEAQRTQPGGSRGPHPPERPPGGGRDDVTTPEPAPTVPPHPPAPIPAPIPDPEPVVATAPLMTGLANGLGLPEDEIREAASETDAMDLGYRIGASLRASVEGMMRLLSVRGLTKESLGRSRTLTWDQRNHNPLRFGQDLQILLGDLLRAPEGNTMEGERAFEQAFEIVEIHQKAMIAALGPALEEMLSDLAPEAIEANVEPGALDTLLPGSASGRCWREYVDQWDRLAADDGDARVDAFMRALGKAYEEAVGRIS
ncbi:MAG: type VI secretion system-associated FHA domain protein TagH [Shimia sp.]